MVKTEQKCPVCSLTDGNHDIRKHRMTQGTTEITELEKSISRHPAGRRRKPTESE